MIKAHSLSLSFSTLEERVGAYQMRMDTVQTEALGLQAASDGLQKKLVELTGEIVRERMETAGLRRRHQRLIARVRQLPPEAADQIFLQ